MPPHNHHITHSEFLERLEKNSKPLASDLGPIGSRNSASSTLNWESCNSATTMQPPRPLNTTATTTWAPRLSTHSQQQHHNYWQQHQQPHLSQMSSNYGGFHDMTGRQQTPLQLSPAQVQKNNMISMYVTAKLLEIHVYEKLVSNTWNSKYCISSTNNIWIMFRRQIAIGLHPISARRRHGHQLWIMLIHLMHLLLHRPKIQRRRHGVWLLHHVGQ